MSGPLRGALLAAFLLPVAGFTALAETAASETVVDAVEQDVAGQEEDDGFEEFMNSIDWSTDGTGELGSLATLDVPDGFRYTGGPGSVRMMEAYGNLTSGGELGFISPDDMDWFAVFEFDDCGYVKDDEKDSLDAQAILNSMRESQQSANAELEKRGMSTMEVVGWQTPPFYNTETNNLEWAIRLRSNGVEFVNYRTKLLGRRGVMDVVLVCDEEDMATVIPQYQQLLAGFAFVQDESYASYEKGDKLAQYGLTGLIVGGGLLAAAKSGLLAKLWKPIAAGLVVVGVAFKRFFTGRSKEPI